MNVCLPPDSLERFKQALIKGDINPEQLANMTSEERHSLFSKIVGEGDAKFVNANFEAKLLLKNQQQGFVTWARKLTGVTPEVKRDLITRIQRLDHVLNPAEEKAFLKDLASTRLGVDVTSEEAKTISGMAQKIARGEELKRPDGTFPSEAQRLEYGRAKVDLVDYVNSLKHQTNKTSVGSLLRHPGKAVTVSAGVAKSLKASLDDSAIFRQGWKTMLTNPKIWSKNAFKTFSDGVKQFKGNDVLREVNADIESRPNAGLYKKAKLDVGVQEEQYPSQLPEKIPLLGRAFKASEAMYQGFLHRQRADIFDKYVEIAKRNGVDLTDKAQIESMGKLVNALTGRGHLGGLEPAANTVNSVFFAPRNVKANIDTLTAHQFQKGVTPFVRKQAAINLVKIITGTAAVLAIADAVKPGSVEKDPRSSDFGKIKIGDTRFDVTGGMGSILTLAARLKTQSSKSGGMVKKFNTGFGSETGSSVLNKYLQGKLSPAASVVNDVLINHQDFNGNKPTVKGEATNFIAPLPITNYAELKSDPKAANALTGVLADALGISVNTYGKSVKNWNTNPTKQQVEFKSKVSPQAFKQANQDYNQQFNDWAAQHDAELQKLDPTDQQSVTNAVKKEIEAKVMKRYGFTAPKTTTDKGLLKQKKTLINTAK